MTRLQRLFATGTGRDSLILLLARGIQIANGFILSILLVHLFGLEKVGTYTVAAVAMGVLTHVCSGGLHYALPRESLSNPERNYIALVWAVGLAIPAAILIPGYSSLMARLPGEWLEITLFAWGGYFFGQTNVLNTLLLMSQQSRWSLLPPVMNSFGMLMGTLMVDSLIGFASILLVSRILATGWLFSRLDYVHLPIPAVYRYGVKGLRYLPIDLILVLAEQTGPLIMANLLTRAETGLFGLCQQLLMAAETPGWSIVQAHYPALANSPKDVMKPLHGTLLQISRLIALLLLPVSYLIGTFVYQLALLPPMIVLALALPFRYLNHFYDLVLRAAGHARSCTKLALLRLFLSVATFGLLVVNFGFWGGISSLALLSAVAWILYARTVAVLI